MTKLLTIALFVFCAPAFAMGPDPGGHTGAGVTPETTKTDQPAVDAARKATSSGKVENTSPADPSQPKQSGTAKRGN